MSKIKFLYLSIFNLYINYGYSLFLDDYIDKKIGKCFSMYPKICIINACYAKNYERIKELKDRHGIDLNFEFKKYSPLFISIILNDPKMTKFLFDNGANANFKYDNKMPLFFLAILKKRLEIVKLFLEYNYDLNICDERNINALDFAIEKDNTEILEILVDFGADISKYKNCWIKLLQRILFKNNINNLNLFYAYNVNPPVKVLQDCLVRALRFNNLEVIRAIFSDLNDIILNKKYYFLNNLIPLDYAILNCNEEISILLLSHKDISFSTSIIGQYSHWPIYQALNEKNKLSKIIFEKINYFKTNLFNSILFNDKEKFKKFWIKLGSISPVDDQENNVLQIAIINKKIDFIKLILSICPKLITNKNNKNLFSLDMANKDIEIIKIFLQAAYA